MLSTMPLVSLAGSGKRDRDDRTFLATDTAGNLLSFSSDNPLSAEHEVSAEQP